METISSITKISKSFMKDIYSNYNIDYLVAQDLLLLSFLDGEESSYDLIDINEKK